MTKKKHKHEEAKKPSQDKNELEETKNKLLRALADFDNYKKRAAAEKEDLIKFSNSILISGLLPITDNFKKAIESMKQNSVQEDIVAGLALIEKQMEDTFAKFGVKQIEAINKPFDPHFHEAIMAKESDKEENIVIEEVQKGYTIHDKLLRPSMVIVSKKKS